MIIAFRRRRGDSSVRSRVMLKAESSDLQIPGDEDLQPHCTVLAILRWWRS